MGSESQFKVGSFFSCEATLDNTQNVPPSVPPSLPIPVKEFGGSTETRGLEFYKELILLYQGNL